MQHLFLFFLIISFLYNKVQAQSNEIDFARYLIKNEQLPEAIFVLKQIPSADAVNFLLGNSYYQLKKLDTAATYFSNVSPESDLYIHSSFYRSFSNIYLKQFNEAKISLQNLEIRDPKLNELKVLNLAGIALLERNYNEFENLQREFNFSDFHTLNEQRNLIKINEQLQQVRYKSPIIAGMLSALIPGSGKVYAGKWKQGLAYFGIMSALGLQWFETYKKRGTNSPYFYLYGSAFTLFYIGNIWGSAFSVQIERNEQFKNLDNNILLNLQLPLHSRFQ